MDKTPQELNDEYCKLVGIKKIKYQVLNKDTYELKYFSGKVKLPKSWTNIQVMEFDKPRYPDFIDNPYNFMLLVNTQWFLFGELGACYTQQEKETFECNYLYSKIKAMEMCDSFGGGEMMEEYKKQVQNLNFNYRRPEDILAGDSYEE